MAGRPTLARKCFPLASVLLIAPFGCAVMSGPAPQPGRPSDTAALDIDPSRAYLTLSQIEPIPEKPEAPETLKPLSERAQRQIGKARRLVEQERFTEAAIELERALRYDPNHPEIHLTLATLHWEAGNFERAKTHVARGLEGNPDQAVAHYLAGRCAARKGDPVAAINAFRTALICTDFTPDVEVASLVHLHLAEQLAAEGYLEASLSQYDAFEQVAVGLERSVVRSKAAAWLDGKSVRIAKAKADLHEKLGRFSDAADDLAPLVDGVLGDAARSRRFARLLLKAKRFDEALAAARTLELSDNETIELLFEIHTQLGHPTRIVQDLKGHRNEDPNDPRLVIALANMLQRLGKNDQARDELAQFLQQHPDAHTIRARLADLLLDETRWEDALHVCADGIRQTPDRTAEFESKIVAQASNTEAVTTMLHPDDLDMPPAEAFLRGALAAAAQLTELAEGFLRQSYARKPEFVPGRLALARLYLATYNYNKVLEVAARRDEHVPDDARLERVLGKVYERLDDIDKTELHLKAAVQLDRADAQAMLALAKLYQRSGRRLQAQRQLQVLLDKHRDHDAARELLAYSYSDDGKRDVAVQMFEELGRRTSTPIVRARCKALLEQIHRQVPDVESYRKALVEAVAEHGGDAATWLAIAESYGDPHSAYQRLGINAAQRREAYRKALQFDPDNDQAAIGVIRASRRLLEFEEAACQFVRLLKRRPNRHAWRLGLSNRRPGLIDYYWWVQNYDTALTLSFNALARDDLDEVWRTRYRLAVVQTLRRSRQDAEALKQLKAWADPELTRAFWHGLARSAIQGAFSPFAEGESTAAKTVKRWIGALRPEQAPWSQVLANEYARQGQASHAIPILETLHSAAPHDLGIKLSLIDALTLAGQYNRASQHVLDWLGDDPENDDAITRLIAVLAEAKRTADAIELIRNRVLLTFDRERFQNSMIVVLAQAKHYDDSVEFIESLIDETLAVLTSSRQDGAGLRKDELSPDVLARLPNEPFTMEGLHGRLIGLRRRLAQVLIAAKDYRAAETQLNDWLDGTRNPTDRFEYLRRLAACHLLQGKNAEAAEAQARALLLKANDISLNNDVAYAWIDRGIRLDEAERMVRYALSSSPTQTAYLDTYGWLLYKKGQFADGKKWLLRAARAEPEADAVILDHLGDCCWRMGAPKEAIEHWTAAVAALGERTEDQLQTEDRQRVREVTPEKTLAAESGKTPPVAPLAVVSADDDQTDDTGAADR